MIDGATEGAVDEAGLQAPGGARVGWVGLGIMGAPLAGHLLRAGYSLTVTTRTRERAAEVEAAGGQWAESPAEVAAASDIVFTMVGYPNEVREVVSGVLAGAHAGMCLVDLSTSEPALAVELCERARTRGVAVLDAPVTGGEIGARSGRLSVMVGGDPEALERVRPLLDTFSTKVVHQGPAGSGQHAKMVNQILVASSMIGMAEGLRYAQSAGLDPRAVLESVSSGAAGSWTLTNLAPRVLDGDFAAGFLVEHFVKDLGIALAECDRMGIHLDGLELVHQLYRRLLDAGHGRSGTQALPLVLGWMPPDRGSPPAPQ